MKRLGDRLMRWLDDVYFWMEPTPRWHKAFRREKSATVPTLTLETLREAKRRMDEMENLTYDKLIKAQKNHELAEILCAVYRHGQKNGGATAAPGDLTIADALDKITRGTA